MNLVTVSQVQGRIPVTVLQLNDRVNLGNISDLEQAASEVISAGARDLLIDLSKVPSLTSAGIRGILLIHRMLSTTGISKTGHLKLVSPTPYVHDVLAVAGLLDYIEVFDNLEAAITSY